MLVLGIWEERASTFQWGKWSAPIRNSILQHREATEVTMKALLQFKLTGEPSGSARIAHSHYIYKEVPKVVPRVMLKTCSPQSNPPK